MSSLSDLISSAKDQDLLTVEATVDTGFEQIAERECRDKLGENISILQSQGRVYFNADKSKYRIVSILKYFDKKSLTS